MKGETLALAITLTGANDLEVLEQHMLPISDFHQCHHFKHDGAPARKSKLMKRFPEEGKIQIWEWLGNSPYLNPIENAWNHIKNNAQEK